MCRGQGSSPPERAAAEGLASGRGATGPDRGENACKTSVAASLHEELVKSLVEGGQLPNTLHQPGGTHAYVQDCCHGR
jgi:hypothetical protein